MSEKSINIEQAIMQEVERAGYKPKNAKWFAALPAMEGSSAEAVDAAVESLSEQGRIVKDRQGRLQTLAQAGYHAGRLEGDANSNGSVRGPNGAVFIRRENWGVAMHGDQVLCTVRKRAGEGRLPEGVIVRVLRRGRAELLGTYFTQGGKEYVAPDSPYGVNLAVIGGQPALPGEKVWFVIERWPKGRQGASGRILETLGEPETFSVNYRSILLNHGVRTTFQSDVQEAARSVHDHGIADSDMDGRMDLRSLLTFTIDGADAKDFDDALSIEHLTNGHLRMGVHIADVAHYVQSGSAIDEEAYLRGTSIYFADQVVPMLPHQLSDDLCSLRQGEDRLTLSCLMTMDATGKILDYEINKSVIRSSMRCIYSELNELLLGSANGSLEAKYALVLPAVRQLAVLTEKMSDARVASGAMVFEMKEARICVDASGMPVQIRVEERGVAERLVEECMLAANRTVARHLQKRKLPGVYRVHASPNHEKMEELGSALSSFGIPFDWANATPQALQDVCSRVSGEPIEQAVNTLLIRAMSKAVYNASNLGHYGLAESNYCHFTSPIRRYPDLIVHRSLSLALKGDRKALAALFARTKDIAVQSTECEDRAVSAERDIEALYKCVYMSSRIGECFDAVVTWVTGFGLFVSLENTIEGLVHISNLDDDYYLYDPQRVMLTGSHTGKCYQLGMQLRVQLIKSDPTSRRIDFIMADE